MAQYTRSAFRSHLERVKRVTVELVKVCVVQKLDEVVLFFHVAEAGRRA